MRTNRPRILIADQMSSGFLAVAACAWFVFVWFAAPHLQSVTVATPGPVLMALTAALPLSILSGLYWKRWMLALSLVILVMLIVIGWRIH